MACIVTFVGFRAGLLYCFIGFQYLNSRNNDSSRVG